MDESRGKNHTEAKVHFYWESVKSDKHPPHTHYIIDKPKGNIPMPQWDIRDNLD